ncbi:MAG TPA: RNA polymerase sigma factor [Solirubrobacteraceae bacterium]|jgi:RNA polymerase sigma-70 factor (ECF subfamily)|nr:RNA polymerase sigma factor [Solirubrobacteraceae bacterium]
MPAGAKVGAGERPVVYCLIPRDLAPKLHEPLRRHFRDVASVDVVVEQRDSERRSAGERRSQAGVPPAHERRRILSATGRRVDERRAVSVAVHAPELPRRVRPFAERLRFFERLEPAAPDLEEHDTARLIARIQAGDRDGFGLIYMRYFDRVYGYLRIAMRDPDEAENLAQQVFLKILEALPSYEHQPGRPFRGWLFTIVRNLAISQLRQQSRVEVTDPSTIGQLRERNNHQGASLSSLEWVSDRDLLMFIERLPLIQRQVLVLRYMLDLSSSEVAVVLDRSPNEIRIHQHRAQRFLRDRLIAIGRTPGRGGLVPWRGRERQALVLRSRRFMLVA